MSSIDPRDPPTGANPEPATFADLEAAGWHSDFYCGTPYLDLQAGPCEVTVIRSEQHTAVAVNSRGLSEANAVRLAHRLAEVLRDFKSTT